MIFTPFLFIFAIFKLNTNRLNMENKTKEFCLFCKKENPKTGMKTCSRKCADELKKINSREERECLCCKINFLLEMNVSKIYKNDTTYINTDQAEISYF